MDIIFGASIIASFLAGMVALFAPCCITVLLPAYIASAFREKKHILKMTLIFFAGIATILVPIGLGVAGLAALFQNFHEELWIVGGLFMVVLAVFSVRGKGLALPLPRRMKEHLNLRGERHGTSVYMLGVLSGAATSCCAPVLAGAITLAALSGAFWKALIVTFAYVFGMVFPLFLTAYFYDRFKVDQSAFIRGKRITLPWGPEGFSVHTTNLLSGAMFLLIGVTMFILGISGNAYWALEHQVVVGKSLNEWSTQLFSYLTVVPEGVWGLIVAAIFGFFLWRVWKRNGQSHRELSEEKNGRREDDDPVSPHNCH